MEIEKYLLFVGASIVLCAVPGPDMILLLSRSIAQGRRAGVVTALGVNLGAYFHLFAAIAGISAAIAASAYAFTVIKWAGAAYLVYLGITILCSKAGSTQISSRGLKGDSTWNCFWQGFWSDVLNPKVAIFYLSFLPQFVTRNDHHLMQLFILGVTANVIGLVSSLMIVTFSSSVTQRLRQDARISGLLTKALGGIFVGLGIKLVVDKVH